MKARFACAGAVTVAAAALFGGVVVFAVSVVFVALVAFVVAVVWQMLGWQEGGSEGASAEAVNGVGEAPEGATGATARAAMIK